MAVRGKVEGKQAKECQRMTYLTKLRQAANNNCLFTIIYSDKQPIETSEDGLWAS